MPSVFDIAYRGGGIKGAAFVGALEVLLRRGHTQRRRIGTSVGAIFATCDACGYTPAEMTDELQRTDAEGRPLFMAFLAPAKPGGPLRGAVAEALQRAAGALPHLTERNSRHLGVKTLGLIFDGAACSDQPFRDWLSARFEAKGVPPAVTLADFHPLLNRAGPAQLTLVAADITGKECLLLNERTTPKLPLLEAVRMSMGVPFVWPAVEWKAAWGPYRRQPGVESDLTGHLVVDGGLLSNFPLRFLLEPRHTQDAGLLGPLAGAAKPLGLLLSDADPVPDFQQDERRPLADRLPVVRLGSQLFDALLDNGDAESLRMFLPTADEPKVVCRIGTRGYNSLDFDLPWESDEGRSLKALVNSGRDAMTRHLARLG